MVAPIHRMVQVECPKADDGIAWANSAPGNYSRTKPPHHDRFRCTKCGLMTHEKV